MNFLHKFFELSNNQGVRGTGDSKLRVPPYDPINREIEVKDLYDEYLRAINLLSSTPTSYFAIRDDELLSPRQRQQEWQARMEVYQGYLNGKKVSSAADLRDIHVCEFSDWRHEVLQQHGGRSMTRQRPDQEVRRSRTNKGQSSRPSGTSRWSEAYHGMPAAVAEANSEVSSNQDLSEVSSVLETPAGRHA